MIMNSKKGFLNTLYINITYVYIYNVFVLFVQGTLFAYFSLLLCISLLLLSKLCFTIIRRDWSCGSSFNCGGGCTIAFSVASLSAGAHRQQSFC